MAKKDSSSKKEKAQVAKSEAAKASDAKKLAAKPAPAAAASSDPAAKSVAEASTPSPRKATAAKGVGGPAELLANRAARGRLTTPSDLSDNAVKDVAGALNAILADIYAIFFKTKNFHWHVSGPHFRDYHLMLDEQAAELIGITDAVAERVRKLGGQTLRSVGQVAAMSRIADNNAGYVEPADMLAELMEDNLHLVRTLRETKALCDDHRDVATSAMIDNWVDDAERRAWFLYETNRPAMSSGH